MVVGSIFNLGVDFANAAFSLAAAAADDKDGLMEDVNDELV